MSEFLPSYETADNEKSSTIELTGGQSFEMSPHNTGLFEFSGEAASRNHVFFFASTDEGNLESVYLFQTLDPENYDDIRQKIMANTDYEITLATEVDPCEERAYQQQVDLGVETWRRDMPDTVTDFLITTAR